MKFIKKRNMVISYNCVFCLLASQVTGAQETLSTSSKVQPNFVVILTDDVGYGDLGAYNAESKIPTPTLDKMASEGVMFTNAHSPAALCAPSRYSMLTGNYPWRGRKPQGSWNFHDEAQIFPGQETFGNMLQDLNYRTAILGKLGIGGGLHHSLPDGSPDFNKPMIEGPVKWGFDFSFVIPLGHQQMPHMFMLNEKPVVGQDNLVRVEDKVNPFDGYKEPDWDSRQVGSRLLDAADMFLDDVLAENEKSDIQKPFLLYLCTDGSHSPYTPPKEIRGTPVKGVTGMGDFTDMIYETEVLTAKLVESLEKRGMLDNTIFIYTSDNGGKPANRDVGHDAVGGLRGMKTTLFEGGTRVPLIIWSKNLYLNTGISDQLISLQDIAPTLVELAGGSILNDQCMDGYSMAQWLLGMRSYNEPIRRYLITDGLEGYNPASEFADGGVKGGKQTEKIEPSDMFIYNNTHREENIRYAGASLGIARAFYDGQNKLILSPKGSGKPVLLYNLEDDLIESNNLIDLPEQSTRIKLMMESYLRIRASQRSSY